MFWKLALRHLTRHWRLNLILMCIMVLGAALLASLPMLAETIASESLAQTLEEASIQDRNIVIEGNSRTDTLPDDVKTTLGTLLKDSIAVREVEILALPKFFHSDGTEHDLHPATMILVPRSFDNLEERVNIVAGRLPEPAPKNLTQGISGLPIIETAIGSETARRTGLVLGDEVSPMASRYHFRIVGIVEPLDPQDDAWWGDRQMLPFTTWRRIYISPDIDEWNLSLLVHPQTLISKMIHRQYWRIILDHKAITVSDAPQLQETLTSLQGEISDQRMVLRTGLTGLLAQFESEYSLVQVTLILLTFQSLVAAFYVIGMFGTFLVTDSRNELSTLAGRGYSRIQITGLFTRSALLLAGLAGAAAPLVAKGLLFIWADTKGYPVPAEIPAESWWLSIGTCLLSWLFLLTSIYRAAGRDLILVQVGGKRDDDLSGNQRHLIWDIFILALGSLAYWQLVQGSTIVQEIDGSGTESFFGSSDAVLLLGPSLLLIAASLLSVRLLPLIWRTFSWLTYKWRGFVGNAVFSRFSRYPVSPSQITLLVSLTAGLTLFASTLTTSIQTWQTDMARYMVGADIRIHQPMVGPADDLNAPGPAGITGSTEVIRAEVPILVDEYQILDFDLFALNLETFPSVVSYPPNTSAYTIADIMNVIKTDAADTLPVVISSNPNTLHLNIGDTLTWEMGSNSYRLEIVGIIVNFPLADGAFAITDLSAFINLVDLDTLGLTDYGSRETWLALEPDSTDTVVNHLVETGFGDQIVANAQVQRDILENNLVFREVLTAFELNALILIPLSVVGFTLIQTTSARRRSDEFSVLESMGLSRNQLVGLLLAEGLIFIILGMAIGTGIGFGLSRLMEPFLSQILPPLRENLYLTQLLINWRAVGMRYIGLVLFYGAALLFLIIRTVRNQSSGQL